MSPTTVEEHEYMTHVPYASVVGSVMYAVVCTKSDLSQAISMITDTCMILKRVIRRQGSTVL